ncbi:MAG: hypothetical protein OES32_13865 [Acidobacteriota bacterium]|nr:hypothetical protein [Acidobacteriota bacterium]MDH3524666.1 hypothetical protein [Acidobacteriota bacterium]
MPRCWKRTAALAAAWLTLAAPAAFGAVDPFYIEALSQGETLYAAGDYAEAAKRLRIACFGLMDEPRLLGAGLVRLALAQAAVGDREAFDATFDRITEIEDRFAGYSRASLPGELHDDFEARVIAWVPDEALRASPAFARFIRDKELLRLQSLSAGQRRAELERLARENPADPSWAVMLAEAQVAGGDGRLAIESLESALVGTPRNVHLECLRGRAYLQSARCETALDLLPSCDVRRLPTNELTQYLDCLTGAERWVEAAVIVVSLPPETREARPLARREKKIAAALPAESEIEPLPPYTAPRSAEDASEPAGAGLAEAVDALRDELTRARTITLIQKVLAAALRLSEQHPGAPGPLFVAGEAAYRLSEWQQAADLLRTGSLPDDRPELLFYLSVSLYETGDRAAAAQVMRRALPRLKRSEIVDRYVGLILGGDYGTRR